MLSTKDLPKSVCNFILGYLTSVEEVEILHLLRGESEKLWTPSGIAHQLRTNLGSTSKRLEGLFQKKLVMRHSGNEENQFSYKPQGDLKQRLEEFFQYYPAYRIRIYEVMFSTQYRNISMFSDAFKISKQTDGDDDK